MINDIKKYFEENFSEYKSTLKDISFDTANNEYTTDVELNAYNYDDIIKYVIFECYGLSCSPDAILFSEGEIIFIEFKNAVLEQKPESSDKTMLRKYKAKFNDDVRNKLLLKGVEGLYIFKKILSETNISVDDIKLTYVLCYNEAKNQSKREDIEIGKILKSLRSISEYKNPSFGLLRLQHDIYYDEVRTLDRSEFALYISNSVTSL